MKSWIGSYEVKVKQQWVKRWGYEMAPTPARPGIYRLKDGGFFLRSRVTDRKGKKRTVSEVAKTIETIVAAQRRRDELVDEARQEHRGEVKQAVLWSDFAVSLLEERVARKSIQSPATVERWQGALEDYLIPAFGAEVAKDLSRAKIDFWLTKTVLPWMTKGRLIQRRRKADGKEVGRPRLVKLKATTVNGILRILRDISSAAKVKFDLPKSPFEGIEFLPEGRIYTKERPNSLTPDVVPAFLARAKREYPQHYLMILLGFVTGARPGELRAIRWRGPNSDINWETGVLTIRRSHSRGQAAMDDTKTKKDREIALPQVLLDQARDHIVTLHSASKDSDLLFPNRDTGGFRTRTILAKPFEALMKGLGLSSRVTPRAMRRTFNDLAREIGLANVITRSISGHQTEAMQLHYSTARGAEQQEGLAKVVAAVTGEQA